MRSDPVDTVLPNSHRNLVKTLGVIHTMKLDLCRCFVLLTIPLISFSSIASAAQAPCKFVGPVLMDKDGNPIWLETEALIKQATHCVAPQMPPLLRQAELDGQLLFDILVDEKGRVACVELVHGHPLLAGSAINAAKDWTFRPKKQRGKSVSFYGHLAFHFTTGTVSKNENSCTVAHW